MLAVACIVVGLVSVYALTRRTWDKAERRRDTVVGTYLPPRQNVIPMRPSVREVRS